MQSRGLVGVPWRVVKCLCVLVSAIFLSDVSGRAQSPRPSPAAPAPAAVEAAAGASIGEAPAAPPADALADTPLVEGRAPSVGTAAGAGLERGKVSEVPMPSDGPFSDHVTVNVIDGSLTDVLNVLARQTGRNIVIGPGVTNLVTLRLSNVPWGDALEVMLKPYGYGYETVGETIVVRRLEQMREVEKVEALEYRVFDLKHLDAFGVMEMIRSQLTERGHVSTITMRGQKGWGFGKKEVGGGGKSSSSGSDIGGKRERLEGTGDVEKEREQEQMRSKTIVVADIPSVLKRIEELLETVDLMPVQVLIESRFVEVSTDKLRDIGVEFGTGIGGVGAVSPQAVALEGNGSSIQAVGAQSKSGTVQPAAFSSRSTGLSGSQPFNAGASFLFQQVTDFEFEVLVHALEEEGGLNVLSAPRILTLNNQEATIIVGNKYPIIRSDVSGQYGGSSTSIDYWQDIGIQLNVVPQVCDQDYVRMIVHPAVTEQVGTASGRTVSGASGGIVPVTDYPILSTREAETQIVLKSGETIVIGGLLKDVDATTEFKVPILGDLPLIGALFRRSTKRTEQLDLLIFLTATIIDPSRGEAATRSVPRTGE